MKPRFVPGLLFWIALSLGSVLPGWSQNLGNAWHIPDNTADLGGTTLRNPRFEVGTNTTVTIYNGNQFQGAGNPGDQTGGTLFYKGAAAGNWSSAAMAFDRQSGINKYWRAGFNTSAFGPDEVIQYYLQIRYADRDTTYLFGKDSASSRTVTQATAAAAPFSIRNRPAFLFHANNRVVTGTSVAFWVKAGYLGKDDSSASRWADHGAVYYTFDGSLPDGALGLANNAATLVRPMNFDHRENDASLAGNAMWWVGTAASLPVFTTIRYRIGLWHSANNEEKFADYNTSGTNNVTFSFSLGTPGEPSLTVGGVSANYTTTHLFLDEVAGEFAALNVVFQPNVGGVVAAEVFSNLNRRDRAQLDANGDGIEDGILPPDGNFITTNTANNYYSAYTMPAPSVAGRYELTLNAAKCGAYRLTARYKVSGNTNWFWYSSNGRRDHAIVVSPKKARDMVMYELNTLNVESTGSAQGQRSTFVDLWDGPGATHLSRWNLDYVKSLGANWLWFQPIHPPGIAGRQIDPATGQPFELGSPYAVKNFFEVMPQMSKANTRAAALVEFTNFVAAADAAGVNVMLDAAFNHTAYDCELGDRGVTYFGGANPAAEIRNTEARFFARSGDYCDRASSAGNIAIAPDRGEFKFEDTYEVFFGRYAALVCQNPQDNGSYLNEGDWFDTTTATGRFDGVTRNVWRYFADYILYWLDRTGCPAGTPAAQTARGIDGLRADFGQGVPPQAWEYIINKARTRKWDFVFMAESLDGGAVTYRSGRHFDVLNENILFALKGASTSGDYASIYEQRRQAYGQALVLLNTTSHDEENLSDPWEALIRYACNAAIDGVPMVFYGQELGISTTFGFERYELNFGKTIPHFKKFNSLSPMWNDTNFGLDQLYPVYSALNRARQASPALRSSSRYFLGGKSGPANPKLFAVAKFVSGDTVLAFVNLDRHNPQSGTFDLDVNEPAMGQMPGNLFGLQSTHFYNLRNLAAYTAQDNSRSNQFLWPSVRPGSDLIQQGLFVSLNKVPTTDAAWTSAPYEAQFLKLIDVKAPPVPEAPFTDKPYTLTNRVTFHWAAVTDTNHGTASYQFGVGTGPYATNIFFGNVGNVTNFTVTGAFGDTLFAFVRCVNTPGRASANSLYSSPIRLLRPEADEDADGATNFAEDFAGTDPLDDTSLLRITSLSGGDRLLTWTSVPGKTYRVLATTNLSAPFTILSGTISAAGATTSYTDGAAPSSRKYYRVEVLP